MQTITGSESSSASRNAWMCRSSASWLVSAKSWIQPASRIDMRVRVVVPDVDRRADRAVADRHHDRQPEAGGVVDGLGHEQQALARGRRVGAGAGGRGADRDRHRGELRLDVDELAAGELARLHHLAQALDDVRLRRDRIGADHLRPAQRDRLGDGARTFDLLKHGRALPRRGHQRVGVRAAATFFSAIVRGELLADRGHAPTSSEISPLIAANPPSSAAFGTGRPMCFMRDLGRRQRAQPRSRGSAA